MDKSQLDVDISPVKIGIICALNVALAVFAGYLLSRIIAAGTADYFALLIFGLAFLIWAAISALKAFTVKSVKIGVITILIEAGALWVFLPDRFSPLAIAAGLALSLFLAAGFIKGRRELNECLKVKFFRVGGAASKTAMTGIALAGTLALLSSFGFPEFSIPRGAFEFAFAGSDKVVANFIPGFSSEGSVDEILQNFARAQLPQGTPDVLIAQSVKELKRAIAEGVGLQLSGKERVMDALYDFSAGKLNGLTPAMKSFAMIVIGFLVFGLAKTAVFILNWIALLIAYLIYQALLAFNFMHIVYENRGKEIIVVD